MSKKCDWCGSRIFSGDSYVTNRGGYEFCGHKCAEDWEDRYPNVTYTRRSGCFSWVLKFFLLFIWYIPFKWPFYTFPRFLKRKNKIFFYIYIGLWVFYVIAAIVMSFRM